MSDVDPCSDELSDAVLAFTRRGDVEPGLDVDEEALLQLRKGCRVLDGIRALREIDRHHTLVVEGSFAAIERSIQFYVLHTGLATADDLMDHADTFEYGAQAGIFADETAAELTELWQENRNATYYQMGRATAQQSEAMLSYATCLHDHVASLAGRSHDCRC